MEKIGTYCVIMLLASTGLTLAAESSTDNCIDCHRDPGFYAQHPKLYSYYQDWRESAHAASGLSCSDCHGGDRNSADPSIAHKGVLDIGKQENALFYKNQPDTCGACHNDKAAQFRQSKHFKALQDNRVAPTCTTCHSAMNRRPQYRDIVAKACETCHNPANSDRVPLVARHAEQSLHRLNIAKGYLSWTTLYYESQGWPGATRCQIDAISTRYDEAVTGIHAFDLAKMEQNSIEVLAELKSLFQEAWEKRQQKQ